MCSHDFFSEVRDLHMRIYQFRAETVLKDMSKV